VVKKYHGVGEKSGEVVRRCDQTISARKFSCVKRNYYKIV
jgi:hypothetical protein